MTDPVNGRGNQPADQWQNKTEFDGIRAELPGAHPLRAAAEPAPYVKEPLFSKKVLFGWGIATLLVWVVVTNIVPMIVDEVKVAIAEGIGPTRENTRTVIETRNGTVTITRGPNGVTIDRRGRGEPAPPDPAAVVVPVPEVVVEPPEPAVAPPAPTGKK